MRTGSSPTFYYDVPRVILGHSFSFFHLRRPEMDGTESLDHCLDWLALPFFRWRHNLRQDLSSSKLKFCSDL